jgi:hypothetical protein
VLYNRAAMAVTAKKNNGLIQRVAHVRQTKTQKKTWFCYVLWENFVLEVFTEFSTSSKILFAESFQCYAGRKLKLLKVLKDFLSTYSRWKFRPFSFWQTELSKNLCSLWLQWPSGWDSVRVVPVKSAILWDKKWPTATLKVTCLIMT